jgi:hypothetical protein
MAISTRPHGTGCGKCYHQPKRSGAYLEALPEVLRAGCQISESKTELTVWAFPQDPKADIVIIGQWPVKTVTAEDIRAAINQYKQAA